MRWVVDGGWWVVGGGWWMVDGVGGGEVKGQMTERGTVERSEGCEMLGSSDLNVYR